MCALRRAAALRRAIDDPVVVRRILGHLGLPTSIAPPLPARSPPGLMQESFDWLGQSSGILPRALFDWPPDGWWRFCAGEPSTTTSSSLELVRVVQISAHYALAGQMFDLRPSATTIETFRNRRGVASHRLGDVPHKATMVTDHTASANRARRRRSKRGRRRTGQRRRSWWPRSCAEGSSAPPSR